MRLDADAAQVDTACERLLADQKDNERSLERLPDKASRAFVLREVQGLSTDEVCRALGVTPAHCWVLVHRARRVLRACPDVGRVAVEAA